MYCIVKLALEINIILLKIFIAYFASRNQNVFHAHIDDFKISSKNAFNCLLDLVMQNKKLWSKLRIHFVHNRNVSFYHSIYSNEIEK